MRKLLLFLCVIGATALMTSCFPEGSNSYTDQGFVYIAVSRDVTPAVGYGRAFNGFTARRITNNQIQTGFLTVPGTGQVIDIREGRLFFFQYSWEEANGHTSLGENRGYADNVTILGIAEIQQTFLTFAPAPEGVPEEQFSAFAGSPAFVPEAWFWDDNWVIGFQYIGGEGMPTVRFYKRETSEDPNGIEIDVRISNIPTAPPNTQPRERDNFIAFNMAEVRRDFQQERDRDVRVRFNYYLEPSSVGGEPRPMSTEWVNWRLAGTAQQQ